MTAAVVLCAGLGTRLRPLADELAKPLMPVGDRPAFVHALERLRAAGIRSVGINTHHRSGDFAPYLERWAPEVHVEHEVAIRGTAGGVRGVAAHLGGEDLVVWNGDIAAPELDVGALVARRSGAAMLWVVEPLEAGRGTVGLGSRGEVVRLRGERFGAEATGGDYLGIMVMDGAVRASLPREGCLVADVALPLLRRGQAIGTFSFGGAWDDVGSPGGLLRANLRWLEREGRGAWRGEGAAIGAGVTLERSVVGEGAAIAGAGVVRESVVLPGGRLDAPAERVLAGVGARIDVARG